MKLELNELEEVCDILNDRYSNGYGDSWRVFEDYSGRFMYGKTCHGLVFNEEGGLASQANIALAMMEYFRYNYHDDYLVDFEEALEWTRKNLPKNYDNLGLGMIYY